MLSEVLGSIDGVQIFPIAGLIVFVVVFAGIIWWVIRLDKKTISEVERLPLESGSSLQEDMNNG